MAHLRRQQDMTFRGQPLALIHLPIARAMEPGTPAGTPRLSGIILSLSIAALMLSLTIAAVITLIAWAVS